MPEYLSPGVFIEEVDAGPRPIAGVSTSTAGMVGVTQRGPTTGKPKLVTNFLEFQTTFGGFLPEPDPAIRDKWANDPAEGGRWWLFPLAVKGFFDNGGQRLYVKRVASGDAQAATGTLGAGLVSAINRDAAAGATTLELAHLIGFTGNDTVTVVRGSDNVEIGTATITAYNAATGRVTLSAGLAKEVKTARGDYVRRGPHDATPSLQFSASSPGSWGKTVQVRIRPSVSASLPVLPEPNEGALFVTALAADADRDAASIQVNAVPGLDPDNLPADVWILINNRRFKVTVAQPDAGKVTLTFPDGTTHAPWKTGLTVRRVRRANAGAGPSLRISGSSRLYEDAVTQLDTGDKLTILNVVSVGPDGPAPAGRIHCGHSVRRPRRRLRERDVPQPAPGRRGARDRGRHPGEPVAAGAGHHVGRSQH